MLAHLVVAPGVQHIRLFGKVTCALQVHVQSKVARCDSEHC
jgi:hypothetical protein